MTSSRRRRPARPACPCARDLNSLGRTEFAVPGNADDLSEERRGQTSMTRGSSWTRASADTGRKTRSAHGPPAVEPGWDPGGSDTRPVGPDITCQCPALADLEGAPLGGQQDRSGDRSPEGGEAGGVSVPAAPVGAGRLRSDCRWAQVVLGDGTFWSKTGGGCITFRLREPFRPPEPFTFKR